MKIPKNGCKSFKVDEKIAPKWMKNASK